MRSSDWDANSFSMLQYGEIGAQKEVAAEQAGCQENSYLPGRPFSCRIRKPCEMITSSPMHAALSGSSNRSWTASPALSIGPATRTTTDLEHDKFDICDGRRQHHRRDQYADHRIMPQPFHQISQRRRHTQEERTLLRATDGFSIRLPAARKLCSVRVGYQWFTKASREKDT